MCFHALPRCETKTRTKNEKKFSKQIIFIELSISLRIASMNFFFRFEIFFDSAAMKLKFLVRKLQLCARPGVVYPSHAVAQCKESSQLMLHLLLLLLISFSCFK